MPSARLELAQLSPLPPQDSVSTNFTTKAVFLLSGLREAPCGFGFQDRAEFTLKFAPFLNLTPQSDADYLDGICAAPEAATAGVATAGAGAVTAAFSNTLPELAAGRTEPK